MRLKGKMHQIPHGELKMRPLCLLLSTGGSWAGILVVKNVICYCSDRTHFQFPPLVF
jgi:hypothetical protein